MKKYLSKLLFNASVVIGDVYDGIEKIVNTKVYPKGSALRICAQGIFRQKEERFLHSAGTLVADRLVVPHRRLPERRHHCKVQSCEL